jgi:hypothetical protein
MSEIEIVLALLDYRIWLGRKTPTGKIMADCGHCCGENGVLRVRLERALP